MSGIAGIIHFDDRPVDEADLRAMTDAMSQRGRDGISHWSARHATLGQCLLATTPEALHEELPLVSDDGALVLVLDGRLDNRDDLRRSLDQHGSAPRTETDAALVLRAFQLWGERSVERLEGAFAFAIWEPSARRVFMARDHAGLKPIYYHWDGRRLIFASELRPVLDAPGVPRRMNEGVLAETLSTMLLTRQETLWQGIDRLVGAHFMTVGPEGPKIARYWKPENIELLRYRRDDEYREHYRSVLTESVRRLSRTIGPLGCEVSGGLDSSALFAIADKLVREGSLGTTDLIGVTGAFEPGTNAYELDYVERVEDHLGRSVRRIPQVSHRLSWFEEEAERQATFPNLPNLINAWNSFGEIRGEGGRVLVTGVGGDQLLFAAQNDLAELVQLRDWRGLIAALGRDRSAFGTRATAWALLRHGMLPLLPGRVRRSIRRIMPSPAVELVDGSYWLSPRLKKLLDERLREHAHARDRRFAGRRYGLMSRTASIETASLALIFEMGDVMENAAGIERRHPYLDRRLVEFTMALPQTQLRSGDITRWIHRRAISDLLPKEVVGRTTKAWFDQLEQPCVEELSTKSSSWASARREMVNSDLLSAVQNAMLAHHGTESNLTFRMLLSLAICRAISGHESPVQRRDAGSAL